MPVYLDTSALVGLYIRQSITAKAVQEISKIKSPIPLCDLQIIEFYNAIMLSVFRKSLTKAEARKVVANFEEHFVQGVWKYKKPKWDDVFFRAVLISQKYSAKYGVRSLDILHVASSAALKIEKFITYDKRQLKLAKLYGLRVNN